MAMLNDIGLSVSFRVPRIYTGLSPDDFIDNGGFETPGAGGTDVVSSWIEDTDGGNCTFARDTVTYRTGSASLKITSVNGGDVAGNAYQQVYVTARKRYQLTLYSRVTGDYGDLQGRIAVYDDTNAGWIIPIRGTGAVSQAEWLKVTFSFIAPAGCTSATIYLYQSIAAEGSPTPAVWYDDVTLQEKIGLTRAPIPQWNEISDVETYRHTISTNLGFDSMEISTKASEQFVNDWIEYGLAREVIVRDTTSAMAWQGFVNEISVDFGGVTLTIGPLKDMVNRARLVFKTVSYDLPAPVGGDTLKTQWTDNDMSQLKYGVLEGTITGGEGTVTEMLQALNTIIDYAAWPDMEQNVSITGAPEIRMTIRCLGYAHMLDKYQYIQTGLAGTYNASTKVADILEADPNGIFSQYNAYIETNTTAIEKYEDDDKSALEILKEIVAIGDSDYNRWIFGVYDDLFFKYNAAPTTYQYIQRMTDGAVTTTSGAEVKPWEIRPGEWMLLADLFSGRPTITANLREDPRYAFIESVTYAAPYTLTITAGRTSKFKQKIEALGLGGI